MSHVTMSRAPDDPLPLVTSHACRLSDVTLHVTESGPRAGPAVILLHGFPEFWWGWRHQIAPLARAGFRVIVPDQRGYNLSDKPPGAASYTLDRLAADVIGIADAFGAERFHVVGHDWGGIVAWWVATRYPDRVGRLVILNAPHPSVALPYTLRHPGQWFRSAYVGFFQLPRLPELLIRSGDFKLLAETMQATSAPGTFSAADLARYRAAWAQPDALTAMINWYRAPLRARRSHDVPRTRPRTLIIWGKRDAYLQPGLATASSSRCDQARILWHDEASHWLHHEVRGIVADQMIEFMHA